VIVHNEEALWRGVGLAPGPAEDMHSGRAEAFGMLVATIFLQHYIQSYEPDRFAETLIRCYCDNIGVTTMLTTMQNSMIVRPNETTADDRDVYLAIIETTTQCAPVTLQFLHVMGHQDTKSHRPLTITEQWNVECDKKAKLYVMTTKTQSTSFSNPAIPAAQPHLIINGKLLCHKFLPTLHKSLSSPDYYCYLQKKLDCTPGDILSIHWNVLCLSMDSFNYQDQCCLVLFINDKLPLQASKAHLHQGLTLCPSCQ